MWGATCSSWTRGCWRGVSRCRCSRGAHLHESGVDEYAVGTLGFPGGILASFACGMTVRGDNTSYVCGTDGHLEIPAPWKPPAADAQFTIVA